MKTKLSSSQAQVRAVHRVHIIEGQINKLAKMIEEEAYCVDSLTQSLAIQKALASLNRHLLEHHLNHCVIDQIKRGEEQQAITELTHLYHLNNK